MTLLNKCLICFCFILLFKVISSKDLHFDGEVEYQCEQHCPLQNRTGHYDYSCDFNCSMHQCAKGCKLWRKAFNTSCQDACAVLKDRLTSKELYCVVGCNDAISKYYLQVKSKILTPPAPALVADSLNATSLKLEWNFTDAKKIGLSYYIQSKYEDQATSWTFCKYVSWSEDGTVALVSELQPYTKYRFRVVLTLGNEQDLIVSNPSVVISTLPSGMPYSPPSSVRCAPIDSTRISVSWEPGPFPHGPLLSYVLQINDNMPDDTSATSELKDLPPDANFYIFRNLKPSRNYTVSVMMRNGVGPGPAAKVTVTTPPEPTVKTTQQPILILGTNHSVITQGADILAEPKTLYSTHLQVQGVAVHLAKRLLFVSDSGGDVLRMSLDGYLHGNVTKLVTPSRVNFMALDLSVDWLNDQLYVLGQVEGMDRRAYQIARCDFTGGGLIVAVAGLKTRPYHMEVDPFNGYLFWSVKGRTSPGLYRLDLSDISNGIRHEISPKLILNDAHLGAFTVDHANFRLLVASQKQKTINTVSLDGKEVVNVRPNVISSKLVKVVSLATANKRFYWTDGDDVFYEEFHESNYFHNSYPDLSVRTYRHVIIQLESSQPTPTPVNPPTDVQAIFGTDVAKVTWKAPHLLGVKGKGAWQNWQYQIEITDKITSKNRTYNNIAHTAHTLANLTENYSYVIKVAAYTKSGRGPWSGEFHGLTLGQSPPRIYWSGAKGLLTSDGAGDNLETLIDNTEMSQFHFVDMSWYKTALYLVSNDSRVFTYDTANRKLDRLDLDAVGSIAVDWLGRKLYWSSPKRQMIIRSNLNGTQQEPLPILTLAKELNIDSVKAYLYWSTGFAVKCAHLNGEDAFEYHPVQLFSGRQVMGLTLDRDSHQVYWIVRGSEGSSLFKAPMAGYSKTITVAKISTSLKANMLGPLCYYHGRLLWLQDDKTAAVSDLQGGNIATVTARTLSELTLVHVVDNNTRLPSNAIVLPESVDVATVRVNGSVGAFNVTWRRVTNVNFGEVFYEVTFSNNDSVIVKETSVQYPRKVPPFTKLYVALRAFTYWGSSNQIVTMVYSPSSTPSSPQNLRSYTRESMNGSVVAMTIRWDPPKYPNGVVLGYYIQAWYFNDTERISLQDHVSNNSQSQQSDWTLRSNEIYYFNIRAFSRVGDGQLSETLVVNSSIDNPIPRLLIGNDSGIFVNDVDVNSDEKLLDATALHLAYILHESRVFYVNQLQQLWWGDTDRATSKKIAEFGGVVGALTCDWVGRRLYAVVHDTDWTVRQVDLAKYERDSDSVRTIVRSSDEITNVEAAPHQNQIYWLQRGQLMVADSNGRESRPFFGQSWKMADCNCPLNPTVQVFTINQEADGRVRVTYTDEGENIIASDQDGCYCTDIADWTLPEITRMQSDTTSLYYTTNKTLFRIANYEQRLLGNVDSFLIYGYQMQPIPPEDCLAPKLSNLSNMTATLISKTSNSLTLQMPLFNQSDDCRSVSMATIEYHVVYMKNDDVTAVTSVTFDSVYTIDGLRPFTDYIVALKMRNFYTGEDGDLMGENVTFRTDVGAPSEPRNVTARVLTPTSIMVTWSPPTLLNGAHVHYEVYWKTERAVSGLRQQELHTPNPKALNAVLKQLQPNETYTVWVKAYGDTNETSSDSDKVKVNTYADPSDLELKNITSNRIELEWLGGKNVRSWYAQVAPLPSNDWINITAPRNWLAGTIVVGELRPKTRYKFRLVLFYGVWEEYVWPADARFTFETLGDRPSAPGIPKIQYVKPNIYKVWWESSEDNGATIELYMLEGLLLPNYRSKRSTNRTAFFHTAPSVDDYELEWIQLYNGTDTSWIIDGLSDKFRYEFRARALNAYGWSEPGESSAAFDLTEAARMAEKQSPTVLIAVAIFTPISVFLLVVVCFMCLVCSGKYRKPKKVQVVGIPPRGPDVELATLRELPRRGVHNTNVLYVSTEPINVELTMLPHIRRDQISLAKFLGRGAFGEVYEGLATGILYTGSETKVAVKTLRKGASDPEKTEFLQEAQLMSNFKHEHILQLLGVCLDNDPHFIIMELMEGGDLLTYLRSSRNPTAQVPSLSLLELIKMCLDVSKGCRYLEEMHFVHRDLACRNCLVSSADKEGRIVKIGDFGLARDIYKNDYYRKEGEGLLPVRWMAPESLVDGVFTSQSDVWAFGVLLWEIMTLGQQPYPARANLEVLHYVRGGGRLGKPLDCPEQLHNLMLKCWEFEADQRPTFKYCLDTLQEIHLEYLRSPITGAHEGQYISTVLENCPDSVCNAVYFHSDVNHNSAAEDETREKTPFLQQPDEMPKYLEILYEPEAEVQNDGYEIPNQMMKS